MEMNISGETHRKGVMVLCLSVRKLILKISGQHAVNATCILPVFIHDTYYFLHYYW